MLFKPLLNYLLLLAVVFQFISDAYSYLVSSQSSMSVRFLKV